MADTSFSRVLDGEILGAADDASARNPEQDAETVRRGFWQTLRKAARHIPFSEDAVAAYYCALDPATPRRVRLTLLAALAYFVLPADAVPDILPMVGFTDDAAVLMAAITAIRTHLTPAHEAAARQALSGGKRD